MIETCKLWDKGHSLADEYLDGFVYPWEALKGIKELIIRIGGSLSPEEYDEVRENVWIHKTAVIDETAHIGAPCIIGENTEVRHCAFIRSSALVGKNCVVGNSTELKNVILFDNVQVPHFNYVGDSILGYKSHMGAGALTSNVKSDRTLVNVKESSGKIETGLRKFGAMLGDNVEVGCNSVLNPGTIVCPDTIIYPLSCVRGVVPPKSILKTGNIIVSKE